MHDGYLRTPLPRTGVSQQVQALVSCFKAAGHSRCSSPVLDTASDLFRLRMPGHQLPVSITSEDEVELVEHALLEVAACITAATGAKEILNIANALERTAVSCNLMNLSVA